MIRLTVLFLLMLSALGTQAQEVSATFRAGLNFSTLNGPSETDMEGNDLEEFSFATGFHIGLGANVKFTDLFGLRAELLYSQKGMEYTYNGTSFFTFQTTINEPIFSIGERRTVLDITNAYLEIPIVGYVRLGRFEGLAGISAGFMATSRGDGEISYSGASLSGSVIERFAIELDQNYFTDDFGPSDTEEIELVSIDGKAAEIPRTEGAYFEAGPEEEKLFRRFDLGLNVGASFYVNKGLFVGARLNYGFFDLTREEQDISKLELTDEQAFILRDDTDNDLTIQLSVGFSF